jgi:long-chain acyl-CoA synthetase
LKTFALPATIPTDAAFTVPRLLRGRVDRDPSAPLIEERDDDGRWVPLSAGAALAAVEALARGLVAMGVETGDRVGILARTSWSWTRIDLALMTIGAVSVPIYETSSVEQIAWIASDAGLKAVFAEAPRHRDVVEGALGPDAGVPIWTLADGALARIVAAGAEVAPAEVEARRDALMGESLATIIYTSGTTGKPKGVELTHANLAVPAVNTAEALYSYVCGPGARLLQFLPLAHVFARQINFIALASWAVIGYVPSTTNLVADMGAFQPTFVLVVPRVLEKVYNGAEQSAGRGFKLKMFRLAAKIAIVSSREMDSGRALSRRRAWQRSVCHALVYRKIHAALGGSLRLAISGGAPLGERLGHFFRGMGVTVYEGYGLTETTAPTAVNRAYPNKIGTVGPPLPGMSVAVSDDGEILVKGPHVFRAYRNNPTATQAAFTPDGWFRTGDVGSLDDDGHLTITGRCKELIVTASGKNVAPAVLEDRLRGHPLVSQCVVVGDQRPFVAALITLDLDMVPGWLAGHGKSALTPAQALIDPDIRASLGRAVERANQAVSRAESIREFRLLEDDFTEANGYLTPSMKVKRDLVLRDFAAEIDALYAEAAARVAPPGPLARARQLLGEDRRH